MTTAPDLFVDTEWIRRAATSLGDAGAGLTAGSQLEPVSDLALASLGAEVIPDVAQLVSLRTVQSQDAVRQLAAIAIVLSDNLRIAADRFERDEAAVRTGTR